MRRHHLTILYLAWSIWISELGLQPATSGTAAQSPPPETCRVPGLTLGHPHPLLPRARSSNQKGPVGRQPPSQPIPLSSTAWPTREVNERGRRPLQQSHAGRSGAPHSAEVDQSARHPREAAHSVSWWRWTKVGKNTFINSLGDGTFKFRCHWSLNGLVTRS